MNNIEQIKTEILNLEGIFAENSTPDKPVLTKFGALVIIFAGLGLAHSLFTFLKGV